jgi:hypothetical protein
MKDLNELKVYLAASLAGFMFDPPVSDHQNGYLEATKQVYRSFFWGSDENGVRRERRDPSTLKEYLTGVLIRLPTPSGDTEYECGYRGCMEEIYKVFCMPKYTSAPLDYDVLRGAA